mmetsp:Transcript_37281/g.117410  ORF Transcript_37281/g.117410 Transcript_37281/m.117410 type:complete len:233 (+) Transcript_37281:3066-3764(+)
MRHKPEGANGLSCPAIQGQDASPVLVVCSHARCYSLVLQGVQLPAEAPSRCGIIFLYLKVAPCLRPEGRGAEEARDEKFPAPQSHKHLHRLMQEATHGARDARQATARLLHLLLRHHHPHAAAHYRLLSIALDLTRFIPYLIPSSLCFNQPIFLLLLLFLVLLFLPFFATPTHVHKELLPPSSTSFATSRLHLRASADPLERSALILLTTEPIAFLIVRVHARSHDHVRLLG